MEQGKRNQRPIATISEAGSTDVIEFHGNFRRGVCLVCEKYYTWGEIVPEVLPPRCECNGILKPDAVFFGEQIPQGAFQRSCEVSRNCQLMLAVGTSAVVYPATGLPQIAKQAGALVVEINPETTSLTNSVSDYIIIGKTGVILPRIVRELKRLT